MNQKLNDDLIARYAIYMAAKMMDVETADNNLTENEISQVEKEVSANPELSEYIDFLQNSYVELYQDLDKSDLGNITLTGKHSSKRKVFHQISSQFFRYPVAVAAILLFATLSVVFISYLITPPYYSLINDALDLKLFVIRGEPGSSLSMGKAYFNQNKYLQAITQFKHSYQESNQDSTQKALSAYYLGITYLKNSNQSILGLFPRYQPSQLDSSFQYLEISRPMLESNNSLKKDLYLRLGIVEALRFAANGDIESYSNADRYLSLIIQQDSNQSVLALRLLQSIKN